MMLSGEEQAQAWKRWLDSADGISCTKGNANGCHLINRLWYAFNAGVEVGLLAKRPRRIRRAQGDDKSKRDTFRCPSAQSVRSEGTSRN
jgi:hypothetical protein